MASENRDKNVDQHVPRSKKQRVDKNERAMIGAEVYSPAQQSTSDTLTGVSKLESVLAKRQSKQAEADAKQRRIRRDLERKVKEMGEEREVMRLAFAMRLDSLQQDHEAALRQASERYDALQADFDEEVRHWGVAQKEFDLMKEQRESLQATNSSLRAANQFLRNQLQQAEEALRRRDQQCERLARILGE